MVSQNRIIIYLFKNRKLIYAILALPVVAGVIYQLIYYYLYPPPYLSWSKFHLIVIPFAELFLLFISYDIYVRLKGKRSSVIGWQLALLITTFNLIVVYVLAAYYGERTNYPFVHVILFFVPALKVLLILSVALCFGMGFGKSLIRIWNTFSFVVDKEGSRKETRLTIIILLTCFIVGLGLRLYNLGGFPPYVDEYTHMRTAVAILLGQPVEYVRAYLTVSLPVYLSYRMFGISLWASRLPMVLINMLAIFPLYLLGRKINKEVGFISVSLFVFSPWIIAASRTVRDYAIVPLFFYLAAVLLIDLLDWDGLSIKNYLHKQIYKMILAGLILGYAIYDSNSVLKVVIALYGIFGFLVILKILKSNPSRRLKIIGLCFLGACALLMLAYGGLIHRFFTNSPLVYKIASTFWSSLVNSSVRQWYFITVLGYVVILIGSFFAVRVAFTRYNKNEFVILFCYLVFTAILVYLTFFLVNPHVPEHPRYGVLMEYWYLLVAAIILFFGIRMFRSTMGRNYLAAFIITAVLFFNFPAIHMVLSYKGGGTLEVTGEHHYLVESAYQYLVGQLTTKDVLVTDILKSYDDISGRQFPPLKVFLFKNSDPLAIIEEYPQGWIAVSPNAHPEYSKLQFSDFDYAGRHIHYVGIMGEIYLWHWDDVTP